MDRLSDFWSTGFMGESYTQWFLFLLLFTFLWTAAVSANVLIRRAA